MRRRINGKRLLALAIMATLLTGGTVFASQAATSTVYETNTDPYTAITIGSSSGGEHALTSIDFENIIYRQGILQLDGTAGITVSLTSPATISVTGTGVDTAVDKAHFGAGAAGILNINCDNTLVVNSDDTIVINAVSQGAAYTEGTGEVVKGASTAGVYNLDDGNITINAPLNITAKALGGTAKSSSTSDEATALGTARGVYNEGNGWLKVGETTVDVTAIGGTATGKVVSTRAEAFGVYGSTVQGDLTITKVYAEGGKSTSNGAADSVVEANAYAKGVKLSDVQGDLLIKEITAKGGNASGGENNNDSGAFIMGMADTKVSGAITMNKITAIGGIASGGRSYTSASADGIYNESGTQNYGVVTISSVEATAGNSLYASADASGVTSTEGASTTLAALTAKVKATGTTNPSAEQNYTYAYGIYNYGSTINVTGGADITATIVTTVEYPEAVAATVMTSGSFYSPAVTNINTAGGNSVKLVGDVVAITNSTNNIVLDTADSYLRGNILNTTATDASTTGINNITFSNASTWQPVFDNRNGSFIVRGDTSTYSLSNKVNAISTTANITLRDAGKIDLTWDNTTRDPLTDKRTMTIGNLAGSNGVLVVNTNVKNNIADEFIIKSNTATGIGIDVAYDPALAVSGLTTASDISGNAKVLTVSGEVTPEVTAQPDSYNGYDYTPTIVANGDGTYSVTKLTITNVTPTPTPTPIDPKHTLTTPSRPMREARHSRMAMHNLWVNGELNNMQKRMGDLRAVEPAEAGLWARYEHDKLEKGNDASLKYNYFQLGYDKDFQGDTGTFYRGVAFSYGKGTGSYEIGTGDLKEGALTLYQTWIGKSGTYYDIIAKAGKLLNDYNVSATATSNAYTSDYHSWGYSIGGEVGRRFKKDNGFFVEPQLEFTLGRINGANYLTSTGMTVNVDKQNTAIARLGVAVGKEIKNVGSYYAQASYYHDFGGGVNLTASDSTFYPYSYSERSAKNWCVFTLGGTVQTSKNCNIFGALSKYTGELSNDVQVNVGARWNF